MSAESTDKIANYLNADLREECWQGSRFWTGFFFALVTIFCLFAGPLYALSQIYHFEKSHAKKHDAEMAKLKTMFAEIDKDQSGHLDLSECSALLHRMGKSLSSVELRSAFDTMDKDNNKTVEIGEFQDWYANDRAHEQGKGSFKKCMQTIFLGREEERSRTKEQKEQHQREYEERMLREPFSVLYAMNDEHTCESATSTCVLHLLSVAEPESRTGWWFMMDIGRELNCLFARVVVQC